MPKPKLPGSFYRICFVIEPEGDVLPLQQCAPIAHEVCNHVLSGAWMRDPGCLPGLCEITPVSQQLDGELYRSGLQADEIRGKVFGPLRHLVRFFLQTRSLRLVLV